MSVIADLIRAGVDPELIGRVAEEIAEARAQGARDAAPVKTPRQARNSRYYEARKARLKASEIKTIKTISDDSDAFQTLAEEAKKESAPTPPERKIDPPKKTPPTGGQKKDSRLPDDWLPTPADRAYGASLGFPPPEIDRMAEDMRLWAQAASGQVAIKRDWSAAFKGWMRRERERRPATKQNVIQFVPPPDQVVEFTLSPEEMRRRAEEFDRLAAEGKFL